MLEWGADYIKIIMEEPNVNFPEDIGRAICDEAHKHNKKVIAHTTSKEAFRQGLKFGFSANLLHKKNPNTPVSQDTAI